MGFFHIKMTRLKQDKNFLNMQPQVQEHLYWCWSAVGTVCALFLKPESSWSQCSMASQSIVPSPGDCCGKKAISQCNVTWYVFTPQTGKLPPGNYGSFVTAGIDNGYVNGAISYNDVITNIDNGLPVAYRMQEDLGFHFVILSGYDNTNGKELVRILDSAGGITSVIPYTEFVNKYQGVAKVVNTFFLRKN